MPESPSSSFIPKRGVGKKPTVVRKSNFVLLSIISYALFVSAPLASAAVFIYERHTQNQFNKAVVNLDQAIENFKEEDLKRVKEFSERLTLTKNLLSAHVSIERLLLNIETATAQTVAFKSVDITRVDKSTLEVSGLVVTDAFDGALFQRSAYDAAEIIQNPIFTDVKLVLPAADSETVSSDTEKKVEFKVGFTVSSADVLYTPLSETTIQSSATLSDGDNPSADGILDTESGFNESDI
jgi:hypothetical protein